MARSWLELTPHDFYGPKRPARTKLSDKDIAALKAHVRRLRRLAERAAA